MQSAAKIRGRIHRLRDLADFPLVASNGRFGFNGHSIVEYFSLDRDHTLRLEGTMKHLLLITSLAVPTIAGADTTNFWAEEEVLANHFDNGVMHVNEREFLMGDLHDWPKASHDFSVSFMVRSSIWLREFLDGDAVLRYQDFDIHRTRDSTYIGVRYLEHQMALAPSSPENNSIFYYNRSLDPHLQVEGYDTYSNGAFSLKFLPKNSEVAHGFRCHLDLSEGMQTGELSICSVVVVYPYATNIVLNGSRIRPGTVAAYGPNFASIAERMLEVVTCIDITENQSSERPIDLPQLLESSPNLTGCEIELMG